MIPEPANDSAGNDIDIPPRSRSPFVRRWMVALVMATFALGIPSAAGSAPGDPVRYRDDVFTTVEQTSGIVYGRAVRSDDGADIDLVLDLYEPAGDTLDERPAIVWVHGGGFAGGSRTDDQAATLAERFAHLGYVTVSIDYRLLQTGGCDGRTGISGACTQAAVDGIADGQAAVRWLRANATDHRIDVDRIGIGGISAGAIIATGAGLLGASPAAGSNPGFSSTVVAFASVSGGLPGGLGATADAAPGILFSGTLDEIVPFTWSVETAAALEVRGVANELVTFDGAGHVPWNEHGEEITDRTIAFFEAYLAGAEVPIDAAPTTTTETSPRPTSSTPVSTSTTTPATTSEPSATTPAATGATSVTGTPTYTG